MDNSVGVGRRVNDGRSGVTGASHSMGGGIGVNDVWVGMTKARRPADGEGSRGQRDWVVGGNEMGTLVRWV